MAPEGEVPMRLVIATALATGLMVNQASADCDPSQSSAAFMKCINAKITADEKARQAAFAKEDAAKAASGKGKGKGNCADYKTFAAWQKCSDAETNAAMQAWRAGNDKHAEKCNAEPNIRIGMTQSEVIATRWGRPAGINQTESASHVREQWVYKDYGWNDDKCAPSGKYDQRYLYFDNGTLVTIQR
jgi:hypothetical protein